MNKIDNNVFYRSAQKARDDQEIKDLKYKIKLLKESLKKTIEAKKKAKYKKDFDVISVSISNFRKQIAEFEERLQELIVPENA